MQPKLFCAHAPIILILLSVLKIPGLDCVSGETAAASSTRSAINSQIISRSGTGSSASFPVGGVGSRWEFDWDITIGHGNNLTFISSTTNQTIEFELPQPSPRPSSVGVDGHDIDQNNNGHLEDWTHQDIMSLVYSQPNLFFVKSSNAFTTVNVFNFNTNTTAVLFQSPSSDIDGLAFYQNVLYWTDSRTKKIMSLESKTADFSWENLDLGEPSVFLKFNANVHGLAVDESNGYLYWSVWSYLTPSSIQYFDGHTIQTLQTPLKISQPQALTVVGANLYFSNRPSGTAFTIESLSLPGTQNSESERSILYTGRYQSPFNVVPICDGASLLWTDILSRSILVRNWTGDFVALKKYKDSIPRGFFIRNPHRFDTSHCDRLVKQKTSESVAVPQKDGSPLSELEIEKRSKSRSNGQVQSQEQEDSPAIPSEQTSLISKKTSVIGWCSLAQNQMVCLNGGSCIEIDEKPICLCTTDYTGSTCDIPAAHQNPTTSQSLSSAAAVPMALILTVFITLLVILLMLTVAVCILGRKLRKLHRKPKIRRRRVILKNPSALESSSVCEMIDIENCCNMNICETPCYETYPKPINPTTLKPIREDKQSLIDAEDT